MSEIGPIGGGAAASGASRPQSVETGSRPGQHAELNASRRGADRVEVSALARSLSRANHEPVRQDLVDRVRDQIERGEYITPERIDGAIDNLLGEIDLNG